MSELKFTTDYEIFKLLKSNRQVHSAHVSKLMESIKTKNLIKDFPLIVNENYEVLDGQHRLEALKLLGLPVYYKTSIDMTTDEISLINTMGKKWTLEDYLNQYAKDEMPDYVKLKNFMDWAGLKSANVGLKIIKKVSHAFRENGGIGANGEAVNNFKLGKFVYPLDDTIQKQYVINLKKLSEYTRDKNPFDRSLIVVLDCMSKTDGFDIDRLLQKLKLNSIGSYSNYYALLDIMQSVYNYKTSDDKKIMFKRK